MIKHNCYHLKRVTNNDIHEGNKGTLRCDVNRAAPDTTTVAGVDCPDQCMAFRPVEAKEPSAMDKIKEAWNSLIGK